MQAHSIKTMHALAKAENAAYLNCQHKLKITAIAKACTLGCESIVYADTDTAWTGQKGIFSRSHNIATQETLILAGIDYPETVYNSRKEHRAGFYPGDFNNGLLFVKNCSCGRTAELLSQWELFNAVWPNGDQTSLQEMARAGSVFAHNIKYDFSVYGVYSKYIKHWPGAYKHKFDYRIGPSKYNSAGVLLNCR
jgi:hypothetical protein